MALTRRTLLQRIAQAGGMGAAFLSLRALGLVPSHTAPAAWLELSPEKGRGLHVVILGAGIAGLVAAYELRALGYRCTVLEASARPGGRNWTVRNGDEIRLSDGSLQRCTFDAGHYQNVGAARLPSNHVTMLGYCRKLGVPLEVEVNTTRSARLVNDAANDGKPIQQRQAINDARGYVSELLGKALRSGELDKEIDKQDVARMLVFLGAYGPLTPAGRYAGSSRSGYATEPGAGEQDGLSRQPLSLHTLLDEDFWIDLLSEEITEWQATMFQPVGGMDQIPKAFARELGSIVRYNAPVRELTKTATGVRVRYTEQGSEKVLEADYCFTSIPLTAFRSIQNNLSLPVRKVVEECDYDGFYKIAWESRRFWEQDDGVYGGMEFVKGGPTPVWLPSAGFLSPRGVLVSGYEQAKGLPFDRLSVGEKFAASRGSVEKLHPGRGWELEKPIYVAWHKVPYVAGSWISSYGPGQPEVDPDEDIGHRRGGEYANAGYKTLLKPDGPVYFIGDYVSYLVGWQEGAALSSLRAIRMLNDRVSKTGAPID